MNDQPFYKRFVGAWATIYPFVGGPLLIFTSIGREADEVLGALVAMLVVSALVTALGTALLFVEGRYLYGN